MSRVESLRQRFLAFHEANPQVYAKLRDLALEALRSPKLRRRRFGIAAVFERLRWWSEVESEGDPYRLNNSYRAFYARLLMDQEPALRGFFSTREKKTDPEYWQRVQRARPVRAPRAAGKRRVVVPDGLPF